MTRVYLLCSRKQQEPFLRSLQRLGVLHVEPAPLDRLEAAPQDQEERTSRFKSLLVKAQGLWDVFVEMEPGLSAAPPKPGQSTSLDSETLQQLQSLEDRVRKLVRERDAIDESLEGYGRVAELVEAAETALQHASFRAYALVAAVMEEKLPARVEAVRRALDRVLPRRHALADVPLSGGRTALLVGVDSAHAPAVSEYLESQGFNRAELPLPPTTADFPAALDRLKSDQHELPARRDRIDRDLRGLAQQRGAWLQALIHELENQGTCWEAAARFGYTTYAFLTTGWVPSDQFQRLRSEIERLHPQVIVRRDPASYSREEVPVAFQSRSLFKPYEVFLGILGLPRYGTVDPVPFVAVFFPLFFGIIVGDMGYAAVFLTIALWLQRRRVLKGAALRALAVAVHAGLASLAFGVLFGEWFGLHAPWPHFARGEATMSLLYGSVALGALQITLGFVLGVVNALKGGHVRHALERGGTLAALAAMAVALGSAGGLLPAALQTPGLLALIGAFVLVLVAGGLIGVLEILGAVTNVFSYARLMGFGLAGVILAENINALAGGMVLWVGIPVALVLHLLNFVLHLFEASIQAARLHYVEFFQKFVELGGKPYQPLQSRRTS